RTDRGGGTRAAASRSLEAPGGVASEISACGSWPPSDCPSLATNPARRNDHVVVPNAAGVIETQVPKAEGLIAVLPTVIGGLDQQLTVGINLDCVRVEARLHADPRVGWQHGTGRSRTCRISGAARCIQGIFGIEEHLHGLLRDLHRRISIVFAHWQARAHVQRVMAPV